MTDDMYNLLARFFTGQATAAEEAAVKEWVAESDDNKIAFEETRSLWSSLEEPGTPEFDTNAAWQKVNTTLQQAKATPGRIIPGSFARKIAVAAAILVVALGAWWMLGTGNSAIHITASVDGQREELPDGSMVYLRKGAGLHYPKKFGNASREVEASGELFFEVVKDSARPFIITSTLAKVQVLGTSFSVTGDEQQSEIIVKTGRVRCTWLRQPSEERVLQAGDKAVFSRTGITSGRNTDINFDAWQTRTLVFNNTPLTEVAKAIGECYAVKINIPPGQVAGATDQKLTIRFEKQSLASVLAELELVTSWRITRQSESVYTLSSRQE